MDIDELIQRAAGEDTYWPYAHSASFDPVRALFEFC